VRANLMVELPFMAVENIMMAAVKRGLDRQEVHENLRRHTYAAAKRVKEQGLSNDLVERLRSEPSLYGINIDEMMEPMQYVGRAPEQVDLFLSDVVASVRNAYSNRYEMLSTSEPRV
jgi:adenylosuccinate lyase